MMNRTSARAVRDGFEFGFASGLSAGHAPFPGTNSSGDAEDFSAGERGGGCGSGRGQALCFGGGAGRVVAIGSHLLDCSATLTNPSYRL